MLSVILCVQPSHILIYFIPLPKLHKAAHTNIISSNIGFMTRGITPDYTRENTNCFSFKMYLSTCERREATRREYVVPLPKVWPLYNMLDISSGSY